MGIIGGRREMLRREWLGCLVATLGREQVHCAGSEWSIIVVLLQELQLAATLHLSN